ncbi:MAG: Phosphate-specific transport system accessory protein PhoU [Promethearchaeota archaeon]|nr:MAG: Phosphate-specific transport system accessory protein PhoU [Candidatus Lokiarchaeota archaeon]
MRQEIVQLKKEVLEMGHFALKMLEDATISLINNDVDLAKSVLERKDELRQYDDKIEDETLKTLHLFQPMAKDLRRLATILKTITYLYRIGRYGKDIAKSVKLLTTSHPLSEMVGIQHMWEHVEPMILDVLEAFKESKIDKIKDFEERDDEIDKMRWSIFRQAVSFVLEDPKNISISSHIIMIAYYLERCGDCACKIAEKVHYMVTAKHIEIS